MLSKNFIIDFWPKAPEVYITIRQVIMCTWSAFHTSTSSRVSILSPLAAYWKLTPEVFFFWLASSHFLIYGKCSTTDKLIVWSSGLDLIIKNRTEGLRRNWISRASITRHWQKYGFEGQPKLKWDLNHPNPDPASHTSWQKGTGERQKINETRCRSTTAFSLG